MYATPAGSERFEEFHAVVCRADDELRGRAGERDTETLSRVLAKVEGYYDRRRRATRGCPCPPVAAGGNGTTTTRSTTTGATTT